MRKFRKRSFTELVNENRLEILKNEEEMEKIEKRLEEKLKDAQYWGDFFLLHSHFLCILHWIRLILIAGGMSLE